METRWHHCFGQLQRHSFQVLCYSRTVRKASPRPSAREFQRTKGLFCGKYIPSLTVTQLIRCLDLGAIPTVGSCGPSLRMGGDRYMDLCFPGCSAMSGPGAVSGPKGGSLTVQCGYDPGWETYYKWWCRGADWGSCEILLKTNGSEQEVKEDHMSIRDSQKNRTFSVTMEKLREDDADFYWCGIETTGIDPGVRVKVSVGPAPTTMWTTITSTNTTFKGPATSEKTTASPNMTSQLSDVRPKIMELSILIPLICAVLLLLLVAASLLAWRMVKRQNEGERTWLRLGWGWGSRKCGESCDHPLSSCVLFQVIQPLEGDLCYAHMTLHHTGTSLVSFWKKASAKSASAVRANQKEAEYVTMDPLPREDISYASLSLDILNQEPTYSNMSHLTACIPMGSLEEPTEYSSIRNL
ncbi:CMRF35-like molecule 1 [Trichechus inunguis]